MNRFRLIIVLFWLYAILLISFSEATFGEGKIFIRLVFPFYASMLQLGLADMSREE
jgi:hypothetical protein